MNAKLPLIIPFLLALGALSIAVGVKTPQQTINNHEERIVTLEQHDQQRAVDMASIKEDISYIKQAVDELRGKK